MFAMRYTLVLRSLEKVSIVILFNLCYCGSDGEKNYDMMYILEWTPSNTAPFPALGKAQEAFIDKGCWFQNCYVTNDSSYLNDVSDFDAIVFNVIELRLNKTLVLPSKRSPNQKYVFVGREPSVYYPLPHIFDGYFNWTWSYRLDSDINFNYVAVKNKHGEVIGPKQDMHWIDINDMKPTSKYMKRKLRNKSIAAAWFVSNCEAKNNRSDFARNLKRELKKYGQHLDIYGLCGDMSCPLEGLDEGCKAYIESDYYFYLAFENCFGEDYVTEKLLSALEHFAVPVVFGGANYTRYGFLSIDLPTINTTLLAAFNKNLYFSDSYLMEYT